MKKLFTLFLALVATTALWAEDFSVGGIYYKILADKTNEVEVTYRGSSYNSYSNEYTGSVTIPSTVTYNGTTYNITSIGSSAFFGCSSLTSVTIPNSVTSIGYSAFRDCSGLTSITIPNSVTSIGNYAFRFCSGLTSVTIGNSVTSIGYEAFYHCSKLTSVTIGNSVTSIGDDAFRDCSSLTSITWNAENCADFSSYSSSPFYYIHSQITSFKFGNSVACVPDYLCFGMDKVQSISIPNSVTTIGNYAFYGCSSLASVIIPENVTTIGSCAFYNCTSLTSITWNAKNCANFSSSTSSPFYDICSQITSFKFGNSVACVPDYLCYRMDKVQSISIPNSVTTIGNDAFYGCSSLASVIISENVTKIGNYAFSGCSSLASVIISENVTTIGNYAFSGCSSLASVIIPENVTTIGDCAFSGCYSLISITIGKSMASIGSRVFEDCYSLRYIHSLAVTPPKVSSSSTFLTAVPSIISVYVPCGSVDAYKSAYAWNEITNIQEPLSEYSLIIDTQNAAMGSASVDKNTACGAQISATANEGYFFKQWSDGNTDNPRTLVLTRDTILTVIFEQVLNIDSTYQIYYTSSDGSIVTPYKTDDFGANIISNTYENGQGVITFDAPLKRIGNSAFENCTSLTSIIIPDSVISIDGYAFNGCSSLISVYIPEGVQDIGGKMTFAGCSSITKIDIPESVEAIGPGVFMGCISLTSITLPNEITTLEENVFANCTSLLSATLGNNIKEIFQGAFQNCTSLVSITVPANVQNIFEEAFYNCTAITSITSLAITPPEVWSISAFTNVVKTIPVYVPCGSVDAYKSAYAWSEFTNIQEPLSEYSLVVNTQNSVMGSAKVEKNTACEAALISATANEGYLFKQWSDGNTDNPRTLVLTQDTILTVIFEQVLNIDSTYQIYYTSSDGNIVTPYKTDGFCANIISNTYKDDRGVITFDAPVTNMGDYAFSYCSSLTSIIIPNSVTSIGDNAFSYCSSLISITIGKSMASIGSSVFADCYSLRYIHSLAVKPPKVSSNSTFLTADPSIISVYVPCGSVDAYKSAYAWNEITNIQEPLSEYSLVVNTQNSVMGSAKVEKNTACEAAQISATANEGYFFKQWSDGNTDNPRTLVLTQDTVLTAIFAVQFVYADIYEETCDSYTWNGQVYTESGDYTYRTTASNGCDSVVTLHLTINTSKTFEETIVTCDSYTWNGQVYTESGEYTYRTTASNGCDSVVTLHLTINTSKTFEETIVTCDSYTWNGQIYTESGDYTYRTTASNGCDSIVTLHLTINKSAAAEIEYATICNGETYTWNGAVYKQAGDYSVTLNTAAGCDSVVSLKLTVLPAMQTETQNVELCTSDLPYSWYGQTLTKSGTYTYIEQYAGYTCDSVEHVLNLQVHTLVLPSSVSLPVAVCGSSIDVSAATADIEAFIASEPTYAANATVTWQQQQAGVWTALSTQPLDGDQGEVIVRYMIISDCGVLESPEIVVPVEMPTPENSKDLDGVKSVSKYNNRIFLFHLNDFVKKYGWTPQPEQVIWYKVVGEIDTYGAPSNDMVVGIGHSYNLPDGSVIKGDYYALVIQDSPNNDGCTSVYRTVLLTATQDENNSLALVPNVVQPNAQLSLQNLDPTKVHEVRVYDTSGDCIATYMAEHVSEFLFNANHVAGYYLVDVINENNKITLRYVVK